jgi:hypothetical protein
MRERHFCIFNLEVSRRLSGEGLFRRPNDLVPCRTATFSFFSHRLVGTRSDLDSVEIQNQMLVSASATPHLLSNPYLHPFSKRGRKEGEVHTYIKPKLPFRHTGRNNKLPQLAGEPVPCHHRHNATSPPSTELPKPWTRVAHPWRNLSIPRNSNL